MGPGLSNAAAGPHGFAGETDTLIVSDLHLGLPVSRPRDLLRLLQGWRFKRLILLGDVFHDSLRHVCADTRLLLSHLDAIGGESGAEIVWVAGNHDRHLAPTIRRLVGLEPCESFSWSCGGRAYHALHGDRFDSFVSDYRRLSALVSKLYAFAMRWLSRHGAWPQRLDGLSLRMMGLGEEVAQGVRRFAAGSPFDVIVCGHTHEPHHRVFDIAGPGGRGVEYFNSGSWLDRQASFLAVDARGVTINHCP